MKNDTMTLETTVARAEVYRLLSLTFSEPGEKLACELEENRLTSQLLEYSGMLGEYDLAESVKSLEKECKRNIIEDIEKHHFELFFHGQQKGLSPYEISYHKGPLFLNAGKLADIAGCYKAFGLEVSGENKERVDHISVELEFIYFLAIKEAYALKNKDLKNAALCKSAQEKFLEDHLSVWTAAFLDELVQFTDFGFYIKSATLINRFVTVDNSALAGKCNSY